MHLFLFILTICFTSSAQAEPTTRTATGGSVTQSAQSAVELKTRSELEVINERVRQTDEGVTTAAEKVEDVIRQIDNLEPVIVKTRIRTVTRRQNDRGYNDDDDHKSNNGRGGVSGGSGGDGGGCGF